MTRVLSCSLFFAFLLLLFASCASNAYEKPAYTGTVSHAMTGPIDQPGLFHRIFRDIGLVDPDLDDLEKSHTKMYWADVGESAVNPELVMVGRPVNMVNGPLDGWVVLRATDSFMSSIPNRLFENDFPDMKTFLTTKWAKGHDELRVMHEGGFEFIGSGYENFFTDDEGIYRPYILERDPFKDEGQFTKEKVYLWEVSQYNSIDFDGSFGVCHKPTETPVISDDQNADVARELRLANAVTNSALAMKDVIESRTSALEATVPYLSGTGKLLKRVENAMAKVPDNVPCNGAYFSSSGKGMIENDAKLTRNEKRWAAKQKLKTANAELEALQAKYDAAKTAAGIHGYRTEYLTARALNSANIDLKNAKTDFALAVNNVTVTYAEIPGAHKTVKFFEGFDPKLQEQEILARMEEFRSDIAKGSEKVAAASVNGDNAAIAKAFDELSTTNAKFVPWADLWKAKVKMDKARKLVKTIKSLDFMVEEINEKRTEIKNLKKAAGVY